VLLLVAVVFAVLTVRFTGGNVSGLASVRLRLVWTIFAALGLQILIISVWPGGSPVLHRVVHITSYAFAAAFLLANRRLRGMVLVGLGTALNFVAIIANNGVMPASARAARSAGMATRQGFMNSAAVAHPRLLFLGDVLAVPKPWPLHNVYSIGDVCIAVGAFVVIHVLAHVQWNERSELIGTGGRVRPT